ncbi:MAG: hypothetical protein ACLTSX_02750 [Collinsella sp.]
MRSNRKDNESCVRFSSSTRCRLRRVAPGKLEDAIKKLDGVEDAKISFLTQKLTLVADDADFDTVLDAVVKLTAEHRARLRDPRLKTSAARRPGPPSNRRAGKQRVITSSAKPDFPYAGGIATGVSSMNKKQKKWLKRILIALAPSSLP